MDLKRPRLRDSVIVRRHLVDGDEKLLVHDTEGGTVLHLDEGAWRVLSLCDGERDIVAIARDARAIGVHADNTEEDLREVTVLLEALLDVGVLADGPMGQLAKSTTPADRPLERLPGFTLCCDGSGTCCRLYDGVVFHPDEVGRVEELAPSLGPLPIPLDRAFTPVTSAVRSSSRCVAMVNDRCLLLDDARRCRLHAVAGSDQKPFGCRFFPASVVDDGVALRVTPSVECACELQSVGREDGEPLAGDAKTRADLPEGLVIRVLPESIELCDGRMASRAALRAWSDARVSALPPGDAVRTAWRLARDVEVDGLALEPPLTGSAPSLETLGPRLRDFGERVALAAPRQAWRSQSSIARRGFEWVEAALARVDEGTLEPREDPRELLFLRAAIFGYHGVTGSSSLVDALEDLALRVVLARAMGSAAPPGADPAFAQPLAMLNALIRSQGLAP